MKIDRYAPSTKKCSCCGYINNELMLSDRIWACPICYIGHDRDENAAINMLQFGQELSEFKALKSYYKDDMMNIVNGSLGEVSDIEGSPRL